MVYIWFIYGLYMDNLWIISGYMVDIPSGKHLQFANVVTWPIVEMTWLRLAPMSFIVELQ